MEYLSNRSLFTVRYIAAIMYNVIMVWTVLPFSKCEGLVEVISFNCLVSSFLPVLIFISNKCFFVQTVLLLRASVTVVNVICVYL